MVLLTCLGSVLLTQVDTQVATAVGADGVGRGSFPVVEIAGLGSTGKGFANLTRALEQHGKTVLDFNGAKAGIQPLTYMPRSGEHIPALALRVVQPEVRAALKRAGLPVTQEVDIVAHSMGGLLARYLVERAGWAGQVDDLVMVATPNHGSTVVGWETDIGGPFSAVGSDMKPGSAFLRSMGTAEPAGEVYTTIGGDPWEFRWLRYGHHGFDDTVPTESPFMTGAALDTFPYFHGKLLPAQPVVKLILATLQAT